MIIGICLHVLAQATNYPGLCEPTSQGGLGFDYFVNVSASEMWLWLLENVPDHEWSMSKVTIHILSEVVTIVPIKTVHLLTQILNITFYTLKIVKTLMGNKQTASKMLQYAENHNQARVEGNSSVNIQISDSSYHHLVGT